MKIKRTLAAIAAAFCLFYTCTGCSEYGVSEVQNQIDKVQKQVDDVLNEVDTYLDYGDYGDDSYHWTDDGTEDTDTSDINNTESAESTETPLYSSSSSFDLSTVPAYDGTSAYAIVNENIPYFTKSDMSTVAFETYAALDDLGRCGVCFSCIGQDLLPDEERVDISSIKPTGWVQNKYDFVDGGYIYNIW